MENHQEAVGDSEITSDDRLWAALSWLPITPIWPILAILALFMENFKDRSFIRYNAILSITTGLILIPLTIVTLGCAAIIYLVFFYWAYQAYQGITVEIPVVSKWIKKQGWV